MEIIPYEIGHLFHRVNYDNAGFIVVIIAYLDIEALVGEKRGRRCGGRAVALNPCDAAYRKVFREFCRDASGDSKPIVSGDKRKRRFEVGNTRREYAAGRDVGWVHGDDVELNVAEWCKEIADANSCARFIQIILAYVFENGRFMRGVNFTEKHFHI